MRGASSWTMKKTLGRRALRRRSGRSSTSAVHAVGSMSPRRGRRRCESGSHRSGDTGAILRMTAGLMGGRMTPAVMWTTSVIARAAPPSMAEARRGWTIVRALRYEPVALSGGGVRMSRELEIFIATREDQVPEGVRRFASVDGTVPGYAVRWDHHVTGERVNLDAMPEVIDTESLDGVATTLLDADAVCSAAAVVLLGGRGRVRPAHLAVMEAASHGARRPSARPAWRPRAGARRRLPTRGPRRKRPRTSCPEGTCRACRPGRGSLPALPGGRLASG